MKATNSGLRSSETPADRPAIGPRPWFKLWWASHLADANLNASSLAAQGLWMRLICLMHQTERHGVLQRAGRPMTVKEIATALGQPRRRVDPLLEELIHNQALSRDEEGFIHSPRLVQEAADTEAARHNGARGGNPIITPPRSTCALDDRGLPKIGANDDQPLTRSPAKAFSPSNQLPTAVEWTPTDRRVKVGSSPNLCEKVLQNNGLSQSRLNPALAPKVKPEEEKESETEIERLGGAGIAASARDETTAQGTGETSADSPVKQTSLPVVPNGGLRGPARRPRGELQPPNGSPEMLPDEVRALAGWNALAAATGMHQATMNADTRRRIRTILAALGGMEAWDRALAAAEIAPLWNGTGSSDWKPTIGTFCKPAKFAKLLNGEYAPRTRTGPPPERPGRLDHILESMQAYRNGESGL